MKWNNISIKPKENSWVLIQSSLKNVPKYEVAIYENGEWYLPANDDVCQESDIAKWCYIESPSAEINFNWNGSFAGTNHSMNINGKEIILGGVSSSEEEAKVEAIRILKEDYNIDYNPNDIKFTFGGRL